MVDLLWSDPRSLNGCQPNNMRGGGSFFGPDITEAFLKKYDLSLIIRSHECKVDGYEFTHNNKVSRVLSPCSQKIAAEGSTLKMSGRPDIT